MWISDTEKYIGEAIAPVNPGATVRQRCFTAFSPVAWCFLRQAVTSRRRSRASTDEYSTETYARLATGH